MISASNNTFSGNNFVNNTDQIKIEDIVTVFDIANTNPISIEFPSINFWDINREGNYLNNYTGNDSDDNGIGDTPHVINEKNQDNHPLMSENIIPNTNDIMKIATPNPILIIVAFVVGLSSIILGIAVYRIKLAYSKKSP